MTLVYRIGVQYRFGYAVGDGFSCSIELGEVSVGAGAAGMLSLNPGVGMSGLTGVGSGVTRGAGGSTGVGSGG